METRTGRSRASTDHGTWHLGRPGSDGLVAARFAPARPAEAGTARIEEAHAVFAGTEAAEALVAEIAADDDASDCDPGEHGFEPGPEWATDDDVVLRTFERETSAGTFTLTLSATPGREVAGVGLDVQAEGETFPRPLLSMTLVAMVDEDRGNDVELDWPPGIAERFGDVAMRAAFSMTARHLGARA